MTTLPTDTKSCFRSRGSSAHYVTPVSPAVDWLQIHDDCSEDMSDDNDPVAELVADRAANERVTLLSVANGGTMMLLRAVYDAGEALPTVRVYGFDSAHKRQEQNATNANPMNLKDEDGNIAIAFVEVAATDVDTEAGRQATEPIKIDLLGSSEVAVMVTAGNAGATGVTLEAKIL